MSVAALNVKIDEAVVAYEAGDLATAVRKLDVVSVLMAKLPDGRGDGTETIWDRKHLIDTRDRWHRELNATTAASSGGVRLTKLIPTNAGMD